MVPLRFLLFPRSAGGARSFDKRRGFGRASLPMPRFGRSLTSSDGKIQLRSDRQSQCPLQGR
jgi:hypothetical protein